MRQWKSALLLAFGIVAAPSLTGADGGLGEIRAAHARLRDLTMEVERKEVREDELQHLRRSASSVLEFSRLKLYFLAPDRLRVEGKRGLMPITLVEEAGQQTVRLALGIKKRFDVSENPRKKQGGLEYGILSEQVWRDYHVTEAGRETLDDRPAIILQLKVRTDPTGGYHKVWVDAENYRVLRKDRLTGDGKLKNRLLFRQPVQTSSGIWLSRRVEVYSPRGRFVGALETSGLRVNQGLAPELFRM